MTARLEEWFMVLDAPPLVADDKRPLRTFEAIEALLPGQHLDQQLTGRGAVAVVGRVALLAKEAKGGQIPLLANREEQRLVSLSALTKDPIISPGGQSVLEVHVTITTDAKEFSFEGLTGVIGQSVEAWCGTCDSPASGATIGEQIAWPAIPRQPPLGLPALRPLHKLAHPAVPRVLAWINHWSAATAKLLNFPDPARDQELLTRARRFDDGAWIVRLTDEPLDLAWPEHLATLKAVYERFPEIGGRQAPGAIP